MTTLGILAGLSGRAWSTPAPGTGLNIYLILVARSATGKEALHEGAGRVLYALRQRVPQVQQLINFDDYASGPALAKQCLKEPRSFVNFSSEFGRRLKRMANPKDSPMTELRTLLTKLYSKSSPWSNAGGLIYSNESYVGSGPVSLSVVGETTPGTLRASMTQDMMEDGFLSRFGWIKYSGDRPPENPSAAAHSQPPEKLVNGLAALAAYAIAAMTSNQVTDVLCSPEAGILLDAFNRRCEASIVGAGENEARRQIWNRANLKARKYASLLAVADDHRCPRIEPNHAQWSIEVVERDAAIFERSLASGDIGCDAIAQERKLLHVVVEYFGSMYLTHAEHRFIVRSIRGVDHGRSDPHRSPV